MKSKRVLILTILFTFSLVAFFSTTSEAAGKVKLNKTKLVLEMGTQGKLKVKNTNSKVKWSTSDKKVVKVKKGTLTPVSVGSAKVTAKVNGKSYVCQVVVADYEGMSIEQKEVVSYALQFVGNRYVYGGSSLTKGTDCSGFTMSVYKQFGYDLFHNAYQQLKDTKSVKMKKIQPGDLIFYGSSKKSCSHVALYIGNGKVVHASTANTGIIISNYNYRKYIGVGRVLSTATYPDDLTEEEVTEETVTTEKATTKVVTTEAASTKEVTTEAKTVKEVTTEKETTKESTTEKVVAAEEIPVEVVSEKENTATEEESAVDDSVEETLIEESTFGKRLDGVASIF